MGFNAGSAVAANALAGTALINTNGATASAMMTWVFIDMLRGQVSVAGACSGIVVGLVAITPACGFLHPGWALLTGIIAVCVCYPSQLLWRKIMHVDDTLDVFTCHGFGGITGAICTGLFASAEWGGVDGAFYGRGIQLGYQLAAIVTTLAWSSAVTAICLGGLYLVFGSLRPSPEEEEQGLDKSAHGEEWEVAMQTQALLTQLETKNRLVNGDQALHGGTISMDYKPRAADEKPVHVEMALGSPSSSAMPAQHLINIERQSSATSLNGQSAASYQEYASPHGEGQTFSS